MVWRFLFPPVLVVFSVIVFIYYTTVFIVIDEWLGLKTSPGLLNATIFTVFSCMTVHTYAMAILKDPGQIPEYYMPDVEDFDNPVHEVKRKVLLVSSAAHDILKDQQLREGSFKIYYIVCGIILLPLTCGLIILLGWHIYLIIHNKTTIEYHEGARAMSQAEAAGRVYWHPYDIGVYGNLVSVLGPNIFSWMCPTPAPIGSGLRFRTSLQYS